MSKLEINIKNIQYFANQCIDRVYNSFFHSFSIKQELLNEEQFNNATKKELEKTSDELMILLRKNPILKSLSDYIETTHFLWESTFIELLSPDEKKKYAEFNIVLLDVKNYTQNPTLYNEEIPYLSAIINYKAFYRYAKYLKNLIKPEKPQKPTNYQFVEPQKKKEHKVKVREEGKEQDFGAKFEEWQIDLLTKCINDSRIFSKTITSETMKEIFLCTLKFPLIVANGKNKLLAYFFASLDDRSLIIKNWQSLCSRKNLFLSYKYTPLLQNHFSSAVNQCREIPPKDCHIIDKYIKQLKKD